jgi:transposase
MGFYVGLDVHCKQTKYCVQDHDGNIVAKGAVLTSLEGFRSFVERNALPEATPVALETGTSAKVAFQFLEKLGMAPRVIDAGEVRAKAHRRGQKYDERDARDICDGLRRDQWESRVWMPPVQIDKMRLLLSRRRHFVSQSTRQVNAAKFLLRLHGLPAPPTLKTESAWMKLLARKDVQPIADLLGFHRESWMLAKKITASLEKQLLEASRPFEPTINKLKTLFGTGDIVATGFVAALGRPDRFETSNHVISYLGMNPSMYDSGESQCHGPITRQGCSWMRALLCEAAHQARRIHHPLNPYWRRLAARKGNKSAIIGVAAHMARILWRMWLTDSEFKLEKLNVVCRPCKRTRSYIYELRKEACQTTS